MLISLDTKTTSWPLRVFWSSLTTAKIMLSPLPSGSPSGKAWVASLVWKYRRPETSWLPSLLSGIPSSKVPLVPATNWSRERLTVRALRATSVIPFLWLSNSSRVVIGKKRSCSEKRNKELGSCIKTLVSSTNKLGGPVRMTRFGFAGIATWFSFRAGLRSALIFSRATSAADKSSSTSLTQSEVSTTTGFAGAGRFFKSGVSFRLSFTWSAIWVGMGGNGMQALLKEKTAKRSALTVYYETSCKDFKKTEGVAPRTWLQMLRFLIQTDCQTFPSFTVHMTLLYPKFWALQAPENKLLQKLFGSLSRL